MKMMSAMTRGVIRYLGRKQEEMMPPDDGIDSELDPVSIPDDYKSLISHCFRTLGLTEDQVSISVQPVGHRLSGLETYAAFVKVMRWDRSTTAIFSNMPQIEKMIDRGIRRSDMPRYSSFAGIRLRPSQGQDEFPATVH